jgi:glycosidase
MKTTVRWQPKFAQILLSLVAAVFVSGCTLSPKQKDARDAILPIPDIGRVAVGANSSSMPDGWMHGAFMEVYVRSYKDSDGDGVGDLNGLISKLDYLADLGIKGIWLMPVTESADRDHGYAVKNYRAIEPDYGTMADFDRLLAAAHARGIGVIIDYVINHSSHEHPLFHNAALSHANDQRAYYVWQPTKPAGWSIFGKDPWYAGPNGDGFYFAGFESRMPEFNLKSMRTLEFHHDNLRFWLNKGVDGMRFDAVGNLVENGPEAWEVQPENRKVMAEVRRILDGYSNRYMVCEVPAAPQEYAGPEACGSAFAFDLQEALLGATNGEPASIEFLSRYFVTAPSTMAPFFANHDRIAGDRLWDQVKGNMTKYKLAAASYLLFPGTPFIYYGEEIGMAGAQSLDGDWAIRTPMSWTGDQSGFTTGTPFRTVADNIATQNAAAQVGVSGSLHSFYKEVLSVRNSLPSISRGTYLAPFAQNQVMGFQRRLGEEVTLVVINYGPAPAEVSVESLPAQALLAPRMGNSPSSTTDKVGIAKLNVTAQSVNVYLVQRR